MQLMLFEKDLFSNLTKTLEELSRSQKSNLPLFFAARHATISRDPQDRRRIYERVRLSRCACMTRTRRRARAKTTRVVVPPSNFTPRTCPHSACPCTRNGALLPPSPTARMHVPAHMTTPYSSHFLEPMAVKSSVFPASFSFVARVSSSAELRTHSNCYVSPSRLWNSVRFLGHADRHSSEEHQFF